MRTDLIAAVRNEEQDAGHDAEYGENDATFRGRDATEMDQSRAALVVCRIALGSLCPKRTYR